MRTIIPCLIIAAFVLCSCAKMPFGVISIEFGQDLARGGAITDKSLTFTFPRFSGGRKAKDVYNYIYFKGDTLCFRAEFSDNVKKDSVRACFYSKNNKHCFPVERLEVEGNSAWGFSLVGSLLENFYGDIPLPEDAFAGQEIPFEIELSAESLDGKQTLAKKSGSFILKYR